MSRNDEYIAETKYLVIINLYLQISSTVYNYIATILKAWICFTDYISTTTTQNCRKQCSFFQLAYSSGKLFLKAQCTLHI